MDSEGPSLADQLEELRALPDIPDAFRLCLFTLEIIVSVLSLWVLYLLTVVLIRCKGLHYNLRIVFVHMIIIQCVERVVRIVRVSDITLHWMPTYEGQMVEDIRRWLWWYCNLAYVFVIFERVIATLNFSEYEYWGVSAAYYVLLASALHVCERINGDLSSNNFDLSLSARFQINENMSTCFSIKAWIYVSAVMNVCISSIMCIIWYYITPNHLLYGLHVISNLFDLVIAIYVFIFPVVIMYSNASMLNILRRMFRRKDKNKLFHKKNTVSISPMPFYPPTTDDYFKVLNDRWNLLSNPQPHRKWFNFKTTPKWIRIL
ncbi:unnamed protein product [Bursaphelenchus okinawaensis]|uniref:G_PROTEIN_RECEP_F1_2 domain-containing protein n=1 Tax=Bursaphelenchus okinawaensis TaxID=465554 RepID=A0A811K900_9BILA|nr:unnamed protein product [Bursaphelenchus okinawaensis]CAG9094483.1 unnamed protein product [Bursaphelenchus okinawaensis]